MITKFDGISGVAAFIKKCSSKSNFLFIIDYLLGLQFFMV